MKITETRNIDMDGTSSLSIDIQTEDGDGNATFYADPECPEDFTFTRDVNGALNVRRLLTLAYESGKRGEPYAYEFFDETEGDE